MQICLDSHDLNVELLLFCFYTVLTERCVCYDAGRNFNYANYANYTIFVNCALFVNYVHNL